MAKNVKSMCISSCGSGCSLLRRWSLDEISYSMGDLRRDRGVEEVRKEKKVENYQQSDIVRFVRDLMTIPALTLLTSSSLVSITVWPTSNPF